MTAKEKENATYAGGSTRLYYRHIDWNEQDQHCLIRTSRCITN